MVLILLRPHKLDGNLSLVGLPFHSLFGISNQNNRLLSPPAFLFVSTRLDFSSVNFCTAFGDGWKGLTGLVERKRMSDDSMLSGPAECLLLSRVFTQRMKCIVTKCSFGAQLRLLLAYTSRTNDHVASDMNLPKVCSVTTWPSILPYIVDFAPGLCVQLALLYVGRAFQRPHCVMKSNRDFTARVMEFSPV